MRYKARGKGSGNLMKKVKIHVWGALRYLIFLGIVGVLWWYFRTYELFLMMILTMVVAAASAYVLYRERNSFSVGAFLPGGGIGRERTVPMSIRIRNVSRFLGFAAEVSYEIRNVFTGYESQGRERTWAGPGTSYVLERDLVSHHAGRVEIAVKEFVIWDWLGIFRMKNAVPDAAWVIVSPSMERADDEELSACVEDFPNENETKKRGTDVNPDYEIREYVPGDELKNIHWKLSAKTGRTMVRERLATGRDRINVLLALTENEDENDALMASLHGLGLLLLEKGYPVRLCWLGLGGNLQGRYLAEEGELESALDEILSVPGKMEPQKAQYAMEAEFPGEAYVLVKNGAYKGAYVKGR